MVREGALSGPIAFTRDHLDAGAMAHPDIITERMRDGSDAIVDWPLLDAMAMCSSQADLVAVHSGGGGYSGDMTSAGVTVIADGTGEAEQRLGLALTFPFPKTWGRRSMRRCGRIRNSAASWPNTPRSTHDHHLDLSDGFAAFRRIKEELYRLGFATAGRPLEQDMPIGGSPQGTKSAAE